MRVCIDESGDDDLAGRVDRFCSPAEKHGNFGTLTNKLYRVTAHYYRAVLDDPTVLIHCDDRPALDNDHWPRIPCVKSPLCE